MTRRLRTVAARPVLPALLALLLTPLLALGLLAGVPAPAQARSIPDASCARHDTGVRRGLCFTDGRGGTYWLGTLRGYDGVEMYCIDYAFATRWGVAHRRTVVAGRLTTSTGGRVGAATVAALDQLVTAHPAAVVGDTTAAAIALVIREVMGDAHGGSGPGIPGGLTVAGRVRDVGFVSDAVVDRARDLWDRAVAHRGPWRLTIDLRPGPDGVVAVGDRVPVVLRGRSGAGGAQDMRVALSYRGFSGPRSVRLGADGIATVTVTAPDHPVRASVAGRVHGAPSTRPVLLRPLRWSVNPRPGSASALSQRGLLGRQDTVTARAAVTTQIVRSTPTLLTQASSQRVEPGALVHDSVLLAGTGGTPGTFTWSLLGPVAPDAGGICPSGASVAWREARVLATGTIATAGDGTYVTPDHRVGPAEVGCLGYVESRPGTATTWPVGTLPGVPAETVLVTRPRSRPCLATVTSQQRGQVGVRLHDTVRVGCISGPDRIQVGWTLHGPIAPRAGVDGKAGCDQIPAGRWAAAPIAARGSFTATRAGTFTTAPFTVGRPGCYTYGESAAATVTTLPATATAGTAVETSLVTRPAITPVPSVPTGPSRPGTVRLAGPRVAAERASAPAGTIRIAALGLRVAVDPIGVRGGALAIPSAISRIGWVARSATATDVVGASVLAGHVADGHDRHGPMAALVRARPGQQVDWIDGAGVRHRFLVTSVARYSRSRSLPAAVFRTDGPHLLRLITCTTRVSRPGGGFHYADNLVVTARAVG